MDSRIINKNMEPGKRPPGVPRRWRLPLALLASLGVSCAWAADDKVDFNVPADEFPKAILEFSHQTKLEVLFLADDSLYKIHTQAVVGELDPREALERMLKGTGLIFYFDTAHSVIVKQPQSAAPSSAPVVRASPKAAEQSQRSAAVDSAVASDVQSQILVTGSLIHTAMDVRAPIITLTQSDFSMAPYPTVQDVLYQLPITSLNTPREDLQRNNNFNFGSGINLRGLGVAATLVLVNGHRQPFSGLGDFVDVSNIPMAAVDHIEILPDGASAAYGSDAIAGVVNIIMKDDFQGAESQVRYGGSPGGRDDVMASQLLGTHWGSGKAMLVYEYEDGTALSASARGYAANADKRPYGGADYRTYFSNPGNILDPNTLLPVYGIPSGLNGAPLTVAALSSTINLQNQFARFQIFPQRTSHSVYGRASQHVGDVVELFAEGRYTKRRTYSEFMPATATLYVPAQNPFNPFGADSAVAYNFSQAFGPATFAPYTENYIGTVGANFSFGRDWKATLSESYGRETLFQKVNNLVNSAALDTALADVDPTTAFNPFGGATNPATLAGIRTSDIFRAISAVETESLVADGSLFDLHAGPVKLAMGLERRQESLEHGEDSLSNPVPMVRYSRHIRSAFAELLLPLVGDASQPHAPPRLELNLAGRYDDYSDFGHTLNPEARLRWTPLEWLKWRASWGRSYRAPKLDDLYDTTNNFSGLLVLTDPKSSTGKSTVLAIQGDNPGLKQETATTWTAGFDVVPVADPGLKFSLTYFAIDYEHRIASPAAGDPFNILVQEGEWAPFITRNPTQAQIAAVCNRPDLVTSRAQCFNSAPAAIVDIRLANLASTKVSGLDLDLRQSLESGIGQFNLGLNGSYVFHFDQAVSATAPSLDILNTFANPLKLRFRATAGWSQYHEEDKGLGANVAVNFTNGYDNPGSTLLPRIDSLTTVDFQLRYGIPRTAGLLSGVGISLNAVNVFNQSPPFADYMYGYDVGNFQGLGRVLSLSVDKKW
jgi:outer membrane receptor protein involved in Fe transport